MYVQVYQGRPNRPARLQQEWEAVRSGAEASVAGPTVGGGWIGVLRHAAEPEPLAPALLAVFEGCFPTPLTRLGSADVQTWLAGSPAPGAAFVQVMQARVADRAGWAAADADAVPRFAAARPDFLGSLRVWNGDLLTVVDSFKTEAEARAGEAQVPAPEDQAAYSRWFSFLAEVAWHDITEIW
jgi:hypothetical protein